MELKLIAKTNCNDDDDDGDEWCVYDFVDGCRKASHERALDAKVCPRAPVLQAR